ncbi:MAG: ATP-binding protein [Pyrinomonadaceae bacterium]
MDFIDWCHHVLQTLERERFHPHLSDHELQNILFGEAAKQPGFHTSNTRHGMFHALTALSEAGLVEIEKYKLKITPLGRKVLSDSIEYWTAICDQELDSEEAEILRIVNQLSPQQETNPECVWLKDIEPNPPILAAFNIEPPPPKSNKHMSELSKYAHDLPRLLEDRGFLKTRALGGYHNNIKPTYQGLVWETRRGFTIESKFIDGLVKEWETTNVDFKREIGLDTKKQKAEFARDVLALANTKSSGPRYIIIGFDDKTRDYFAPPDSTVTQDRMERILSDLTDPVVAVRYGIVKHRLGEVGKLEVIREPEKLPYRASKEVLIDEKGKKGLEKDKVYVRHGSQTEAPTPVELDALKDEGRRARGEV